MEIVRIAADGAGDPHHAPDGGPAVDRLPLVLVTWRDAWFDFEQPDGAEPRSDYLVTTVGFVVGRGPRFLSVAQEVLPEGDGCRAVTHIPLSVVESVVPLRVDDRGAATPVPEDLYSADPDARPASDLGRRDA